MARTDIHRPSAIIPSDYEMVVIRSRDEFTGEFVNDGTIEIFNAHRERTGGRFNNTNPNGNCDVCGARMIDYAIFYHYPTNAYIRTGHDCASKIEDGHEDNFNMVAARRRNAQKRAKAVAAACDTLASLGIVDVAENVFTDSSFTVVNDIENIHGDELIDSVTVVESRNLEYDVYTFADLVRNLVKFGWSNKQEKFAVNVATRIRNAKQVIFQKREEYAAAADAPEGKVLVKGKVVSVKPYENAYGVQWKMVVVSEEGWKVFASVPKAIYDCKVGDFVEFYATLERSNDDPKFAFGKRPTKAKYIV